ncbi:MAG: DUF6174 domain-containing protein [Rhodothermales bacterium]|nr:DUF6174 domain-containing protein [Rhodothermales bacterium]
MPTRFLALLLLPVLLGGCALLGDGGGPRSELERRQQQWARQGFDAYTYDLNIACFCPYFGPVHITVRADTVAALEFRLPPDVPPPSEHERRFFSRTVEDLFDVIDDALREGADELDVEYHPEFGYPTHISIDYYEDAVDDEIGYTASNLQPLRLPRSPSPAH